MKKLGIVLAMLATVFATAAENPRQSYIWTVAHNRMVRHMDGWFADGDFPRCLQMLRFEHAIDPEDYETTTDLGWMFGNMERTTEELEVYIDYRVSYPLLADSSFPEAQFYFLKKQYDKVPELLEPKLPMKPQPNAYRILAHSYEQLNRFNDCIRVWKLFLTIAPNDAMAEQNMARVEKKLKEKQP
jgi:tetratricopeptide (TPR) repeat protein